MKTIKQIGELIFNDENMVLLLAAHQIQPFLTKAVQHQFDDSATRYFFDKKNRELFKDDLLLSTFLYGDFGIDANITKEQITAYKKRRDKLSDCNDLLYSSPKDSDIIEIPRLNNEEWGEIFSKLLSEVGSSSSYHEQLLSNYSKYTDGSSSEKYIRNALLENIQDEVLITNFDYLISLRVNEKIIGFLWENRLNDNNEDLFKGISVFELSDYNIFITNEDKMKSSFRELTKESTDRKNDKEDDSNVSNWLWGISFFILLKLIYNYFN